MFRRTLLSSVAVTALVAGCETLSPTLSKVAADIKIIANGLRGALFNIANLGIVPPNVSAQILVWLDGISRAADSAASALTESGARDAVSQIEVLLNSIVTSLLAFPLPPAITTALTAASILLPVVESLLGMVIKPMPAMPKAVVASPVRYQNEARLYLQSVAVAK